jgi:hypothetical protein
MVGKGASRGSVGHAAVLLDRIRANPRISLKPERLLKGETRKRRDLFPRCKRFFLDPTPLSHGSFHSASLSAGGAPERAVT